VITTHLVVLSFFDGAGGSIAPVAEEAPLNTGGWLSPEQVRKLRAKEKRSERVEREQERRRESRNERVAASIRDAYDRVDSPQQAQVAEIVRPFVRAGTDMQAPPTQSIDWTALARDRAVVAAVRSALSEMVGQEEDEAMMVLLML